MLVKRFREEPDAEEAKRLGDRLGRLVFRGQMPRIERWDKVPAAVREHWIDRMRDRAIGIADLNRLRLGVETQPEGPEGDWQKDFGSFKICGRGSFAKTFLLRGQLR